MAQQARPKVTGQIEERRAHCTIFSTRGGQHRNFEVGLEAHYAFSFPQSSAPLRQT